MRSSSLVRRAPLAGLLALLAAAPLRGQAPQPQPNQAAATLVVQIEAKARLKVDDTMTKQTGGTRRFVTPPLAPGKRFYYTLVATWEPNNYTTITRTRTVAVEAGKETPVDLTREDPKQRDNVVIRWVPTPEEAVDAMLKLGKVGKDDVVYDLGCGDGRLVIAAVKKFGARRGVGIDLDPQRIKESKENAKKAGVEDKVEFRQGNVLDLKEKDLAQATVVTLFMSESINLRLRPLLQKTLKPGARIVTHQFRMGDWKPDKTTTVEDPEWGEIELFEWTIKDKK